MARRIAYALSLFGITLMLVLAPSALKSQTPAPASAQPDMLQLTAEAHDTEVRPVSVSITTNLALGALAGWWSFCIIESSQMDPVPELILLFAIIAALIRVGIYCSGVTTPFNIWGRISSGRIIVPGFDKVFLTSLAVVLAAILGDIIIKCSGPLYPVAESCVITLIWYMLFGGGPSLRNWALTGQHRLRPPPRLNASKQMLRPV